MMRPLYHCALASDIRRKGVHVISSGYIATYLTVELGESLALQGELGNAVSRQAVLDSRWWRIDSDQSFETNTQSAGRVVCGPVDDGHDRSRYSFSLDPCQTRRSAAKAQVDFMRPPH